MADLYLYEVPHRGHKTVVKLSEEEAKALYGDNAKKVGPARKAEAQPVARPPWDSGEVRDPADDSSTEAGVAGEKRAAAPKNKARGAENKDA